MKITLKALASVLGIVTLLTIFGCGGDPPPSKSIQDQQLEKLSATWNVSTVTLSPGPVDKTADYKTSNFQLVISGTPGTNSFSYSTSGRPAISPWPATGTATFGVKPETQFTRDSDKVDMAYSISADGKTLQINFNFAGAGYPARVSNVKGDWAFTFVKA